MTKRKRTPKATPSESGEGEGDPTVHVSPDLLAGSPDVFASSKGEPADTETPAAMTSDGTPEETAVAAEEPPAEEPAAEETPAVEAPPPAAAAPVVVEPAAVIAPPPPPYQPHAPAYIQPVQPPRRAGSSVALGIVLLVLGVFALIVQFTGFDPGGSWPLFVIIPGLTLLLVGYISLGTGALIPGAILTVIGLILAYMNATQDWPAWAFVWPLVAPGGVGLGIFLQGLRKRDPNQLRQGRVLMFIALVIFMIAFVIFGTIFKISGTDYGWVGKAALPALLIVVGILLLGRSIQRSRQA
ncbi:MAG TPA: hypothetical protein VLR46_06475 [Candidatus Dormibacteraeota bacterium]|nr:hypothetical protein [Candidatus Dormibacteraeota bacterium]